MARPAARRQDPRRDRPLARRLPRPHAALDLHRRLPRRDRGRVRSTCSTGSTRPSSTASAPSATRTSPAPAPTPCPTMCPRRSRRSAGSASWPRPRAISAAKLAARVGTRTQVIVDEVDADGATCRTRGDAPEIDGNLFIDEDFERLQPGDIVTVDGRRGLRLRPLGPPHWVSRTRLTELSTTLITWDPFSVLYQEHDLRGRSCPVAPDTHLWLNGSVLVARAILRAPSIRAILCMAAHGRFPYAFHTVEPVLTRAEFTSSPGRRLIGRRANHAQRVTSADRLIDASQQLGHLLMIRTSGSVPTRGIISLPRRHARAAGTPSMLSPRRAVRRPAVAYRSDRREGRGTRPSPLLLLVDDRREELERLRLSPSLVATWSSSRYGRTCCSEVVAGS